ncbi:MAG TPA: M1 family aminopeptidase [Bryobacteraceae bacterium]|nr:M1 family aminopeptidase [Bryobacteraceae bacterium]
MKNTKFALALASALLSPAFPQSRGVQQRIDVQDYAIDLTVDPQAQTLKAVAKVNFTALDNVSEISLDLNNALNLDKVAGDDGRQIPASRLQQDMSVRVSLPAPIARGKSGSLTFYYDGKLSGEEESPVFGIRFAAIHPDFAYLMYPARWFPVNDYTVDRFAMDLKVAVPQDYKVLASGIDSTEPAQGGGVVYRWKVNEPSFPGSLAIVRGDPKIVSDGGVDTALFFRKAAGMEQAWGGEFSKAMIYLSSVFGSPLKRNLTVVETEPGAPNGYSAPGLIFLSPQAIGKEVNIRLVANQVSRQWWGALLSPSSRNHLWIENGMARYSELLYVDHANGSGAMQQQVHDTYVEALTVDQPPLIQSARLEDYSPEFWAATAGKGAAVLNMLRGVVGDENFFKLLKTLPDKYAYKSISTDDFRKSAEEISAQNLNFFFVNWIESTGAPEFKLEYTVFRTQKGFRVVGKIGQDLDTFSMPVTVHVDTEGNPEEKEVQVVGTSSEFSIDTFGKPRPNGVSLDPKGRLLRFDNPIRVAVAIRRGEQFVEIGEFGEALKEYQKALDVQRNSSLAHYRIGELYFLQATWQSAANEFREAINGDLEPKWTEVWSHIKLGWVLDVSGQRDRAVNEYKQALRTNDNTSNAQEEAQKYINAPYERQRASN